MLLERLGRLLGAEDPKEGPPDERALHLASAILLFEVAKADHQLDRTEVERLQQVLRDYWDLEQGSLDELLEVAERESDNAASLHRQLDLLNDSLSPQRKFQLMYGLWRIACADGQIDPYEEHLVRRLADLLYVPHREFIRAKLEALGD
jgi:uncharacterized tellurite resistance protein B-like protein